MYTHYKDITIKGVNKDIDLDIKDVNKEKITYKKLKIRFNY